VDVSTLHALTEDLAGFLSEVTQGELRRATPGAAGDIGDLYLHLISQNVAVATAITGEEVPRSRLPEAMDRVSLDASVDLFGSCGLETGYRQTAHLMENAFARTTGGSQVCRINDHQSKGGIVTLYETQVGATVIHTWDIAEALGFSYQPSPLIARQILRSSTLLATQQPDARADNTQTGSRTLDDDTIFECVLRLSGRCRPSREHRRITSGI
jgi:hypothetical protein